MIRKIDLIISWLILLGGLVYCALTFVWHQYGLENAYFPAIALLNVLMGVTNIFRVTDNQPVIVKCAIPVNVIVLGYALYVIYLLANKGPIPLPPIVGTTWMAIVFVFSLFNFFEMSHKNTLVTAKKP